MNVQNNIFLSLNKIYSTNGNDKNYWKELLFSIKNDSSLSGIIDYFNQRIKNEPSNILNLDILDFLIDYGSINLVREIAKIDLMMNVFNLLRKSSGSGPEVQKKGIYLTKKWFELANNNNENLEGFIKNYHELQSKGISFPPSGYKLNTYEQYISIHEINNLLSNMNPSKSQINNENNLNNTYENYEKRIVNIINYKLDNNSTPFQTESKYDNDDDIPSNDIPKLDNSNNFENKINLEMMKSLADDTIYVNNIDNDNPDFQNENKINNHIDNNISKEIYFDKKFKNEKEEDRNIKFEKPFSENQNQLNKQNFKNPFADEPEAFNEINEKHVENSIYPEYNEQEIKDNNKYPERNTETKSGNDLYCAPTFNNTPYGNKNFMPVENKKYKTIYNCGFKSYMDETYGNNNKPYNNSFNNNYNNYYNNQNNNYNNKPIENNQMQNNQNNNNMNEPNNATFLYKHSWILKIQLYNQWMNQGSNDLNLVQLKTAIKNILNETDKIESLLQKYNKEGDLESVSIILKLRSDMNQTCYRFERYIRNQPYENFFSAFDGNIKVYNFNKEFILSYLESNEHNNKYVEGLKKIGGAMKKGIFTAGSFVKDNTVKGINFVKEKVHKDKSNEFNKNSNNLNRYNNNRNNINDFSNSSDNYANNQNHNNYNNQNNNFNNYNNYNSFNNQQNNYNNFNRNNNNQFNSFNNNQNNRNFY